MNGTRYSVGYDVPRGGCGWYNSGSIRISFALICQSRGSPWQFLTASDSQRGTIPQLEGSYKFYR